MKLLVITQKVDLDDEPMGFFVRWLEKLSEKVEKLYVICGALGRYHLPANVQVYSMGREKGFGSIRRYLNFYKYFFRLIWKVDGIFAHMSPTYPIISWPALLLRKPIILWYAHIISNKRLIISEKIVRKILSISKESFALKSKKLIATGHGIDVDFFNCLKRDFSKPINNIITIGRITPVKEYETILEAMNILVNQFKFKDFTFRIVGSSYLEKDIFYFEKLKKYVSENGLSENIIFEKGVPNPKTKDYYCQSDIFINAQAKGGVGKATLEAMACGCLPVISSPAINHLLGEDHKFLVFKDRDSNDCAKIILELFKLNEERKKNLSVKSREIVVNHHNLDHLIYRIIEQFR